MTRGISKIFNRSKLYEPCGIVAYISSIKIGNLVFIPKMIDSRYTVNDILRILNNNKKSSVSIPVYLSCAKRVNDINEIDTTVYSYILNTDSGDILFSNYGFILNFNGSVLGYKANAFSFKDGMFTDDSMESNVIIVSKDLFNIKNRKLQNFIKKYMLCDGSERVVIVKNIRATCIMHNNNKISSVKQMVCNNIQSVISRFEPDNFTDYSYDMRMVINEAIASVDYNKLNVINNFSVPVCIHSEPIDK